MSLPATAAYSTGACIQGPLRKVFSPVNEARPRQVLSLALDPENHIRLTVGELSRTGESYYLGIAPDSLDDDCRPAAGLKRLLTSWIRQIVDAAGHGLVYLPFDFSDEYTRWLACELANDEVTVVLGWADVEGWAISPSDLTAFASHLPGFRPEEPLVAQTFYLPWFVSQLRRSRSCLRASDTAPLTPEAG